MALPVHITISTRHVPYPDFQPKGLVAANVTSWHIKHGSATQLPAAEKAVEHAIVNSIDPNITNLDIFDDHALRSAQK